MHLAQVFSSNFHSNSISDLMVQVDVDAYQSIVVVWTSLVVPPPFFLFVMCFIFYLLILFSLSLPLFFFFLLHIFVQYIYVSTSSIYIFYNAVSVFLCKISAVSFFFFLGISFWKDISVDMHASLHKSKRESQVGGVYTAGDDLLARTPITH